MAETRTIDDMGVDVSNAWARARQLSDSSLSIQKSSQISDQVRIDVLAPLQEDPFLSHFKSEKRGNSWANFCAPPDYGKGRNSLFTSGLAPSLGTAEQGQALIEKLRQMSESEFRELIDGLEQFQSLNAELNTINGRRSQFAKG